MMLEAIMQSARPLPTVIGPTENALRALLEQTIEPAGIRSYAEWVVLNLASTSDGTTQLLDHVVSALKRPAAEATDVVRALQQRGYLDDATGRLTPAAEAALARGRASVADVTDHVTEGISSDDLDVTVTVLDLVRQRVEERLVPRS